MRPLLLSLAVCLCFTIQAQQSAPRSVLSLDTRKMLQTATAETRIPVLIKGDIPAVIQFIQQGGGNYKFTAGDILSADLSPELLRSLNASGLASFIDCPTSKFTTLNDVMVKHNNVDSAYYGFWPLEMAYDGSGVVIGIIDDPFDLDHPDFYDADGNNRIKYVWDQNLATGAPPAPYTYGIECDSIMIANGTCPSTDDNELNYSHGSGVTGVAASSGLAANQYRGVAPNADIICVSLNFQENFETNLTDAIAYIYQRAAEMGKPCVINTSLGTYAGSHDGTDLTAQLIDALIVEQSGRAFVAAGGNAGNFAFHLGYDVTPTEQFTWFKKLSYMNLVYTQIWADTAELNDVFFRIVADNPATYTMVGSTPLFNIQNDFDFAGDIVDSVTYTIPGAGTVTIYAQLDGGKYLLELVAVPTVSTYYWRFATSGSGRFDCWSMEATTGFSNYVSTGLPSAAVMPEIVNYKLPDFDQTIVGSWQCLDNVITVGSYVNRDTMTNFYGDYPPLVDEVGALFYSSSHGPTRDGRIKPDICAPGARVLSTAATILTDWLISEGAANYMSADGQHYLYNGTSFASPAVAGIAALYLQKNPDATAAEVKQAIISQARKDTYTGVDLPNNLWGYGKADAFRTLTGPWGCSADDYTNPPQNPEVLMLTPTKAMLNWDVIPNAAGYQIWYKTAGAPAGKVKALTNTKTVSGLTPNTTYQAKVRAYCTEYGFSNYSTIITFTTPPLKQGETEAQNVVLYPNPAGSQITIDGIAEGAVVMIYDMLGNTIATATATTDQYITFNTYNWADGMYQAVIIEAGENIGKRFIIAH